LSLYCTWKYIFLIIIFIDAIAQDKNELECGPMPNVMAALPNIGGALCSTPQSFADPSTRVPCSNAAKTQKSLKLAGVPQSNETISAASRPKFTLLHGHVEEILLFKKFFFPIVDTCLSCEDIARQSCAMMPIDGDFLDFRSYISSELRAVHFIFRPAF